MIRMQTDSQDVCVVAVCIFCVLLFDHAGMFRSINDSINKPAKPIVLMRSIKETKKSCCYSRQDIFLQLHLRISKNFNSR